MDNILDFNDDDIKWVAYIFPQPEQVQLIADLLGEHKIPHKIDPLQKQQREIIPINPQLQLYQSHFQIKIPNNRTQQVDKLMNEHPELFADEDSVRKLFLANSLDPEGWIDILLFPDEWMERDVEFAKELLASKGIAVDPNSYDERRAKRRQERLQENTFAQKQSTRRTIGIILIVIAGIAWILFGGGL